MKCKFAQLLAGKWVQLLHNPIPGSAKKNEEVREKELHFIFLKVNLKKNDKCIVVLDLMYWPVKVRLLFMELMPMVLENSGTF